MRRFERIFAVIGAAALLVTGSAVATQANNGNPIKIGRINKGTKKTTLKITRPVVPFKIQTSSTSVPPLETNSTAQVANLNVSYVGGADFKTYTFADTADRAGDTVYDFTVPEAGTYALSLYATAVLGGTNTPGSPNQWTCKLNDQAGAGKIVIEAKHVDEGYIFWPTLSSYRIVNLTSDVATRQMELNCQTSKHNGWSLYSPTGTGPTVSFTRIPAATITALTPAS